MHFNTSYDSLKAEIFSLLRVFAQGVESYYLDHNQASGALDLTTNLSCDGVGANAKWAGGEHFYRYLKNVSIDFDSGPSKPPLKFNQENALSYVELQIMNLRAGSSDKQLVWEQVSDVRH